MKRLTKKEPMPFSGGVSTMRAWKKGVIQSYLDTGLSLHEAIDAAEKAGGMVYKRSDHNLVTNSGYNLFAKFISATETTGLTYFEIGTGSTSPALTDTDLVTGVSRKQFTTRTPAGATTTLSVFYPSEDCTYNIAEAGVFGGAAATSTLGTGTLFSRFLQTYDNSAGEFDLTFEYVLTLQSA